MKYGYESMNDLQRVVRNDKTVKAISLLLFVLMLFALIAISGCSVAINVAAEGQPCTIIYTNEILDDKK